MGVKGSRWRELPELVTDHVLSDQHRDKFVAVIDTKCESDKLWKDRRPTRPSPDNLVAARPARLLRLLEEVTVDKWSFPN